MFGVVTSPRFIVFMGGLIFFLVLELAIPYRERTVSKARRWSNNLGLTFFNALLLYVLFAETSGPGKDSDRRGCLHQR